MTNHIRISDELRDVMNKHLEELKAYMNVSGFEDSTPPEEILMSLERLSTICEYPTRRVPFQLYEEASDCQARIEDFLSLMHTDYGMIPQDSETGRILARARDWFGAIAAHQQHVTLDEVWDFIAPVRPDRLDELGNGVYEAKWWKPVPMMDVEILQHTEGVAIQGEPSEPVQLPGGIAVRFSVEFEVVGNIR